MIFIREVAAWIINFIATMFVRLWFGMVLVYCAQHHFLQYFSYIVAVSFISGGNRSTRRTTSHWCMRVDILLICGKHTILLKGVMWAHKTNLTRHLFCRSLCTKSGNEWSCTFIYVLVVSNLPLSTNFWLGFETVPTFVNECIKSIINHLHSEVFLL